MPVESAGNASLHSFDPSDPLSPQHNTHTTWNADTGASAHMTPNHHWLHNYTPHCVPIKLADGSIVYSEGVGCVLFILVIQGKEMKVVEFTKVLHVP
jgi:hypothetical protein